MTLSNDVLDSLDKGQETISVFFDLSKAFDSVPHAPLLQKLLDIQINPFILYNYLSQRKQFVVVNGSQSSELDVTSGVPQGSVLGPLLFLIYINGVSCIALNGKLLIYADSIALYQIIHAPSDYLLVQNDINAISVWTNENFLHLNTNKCCFMLFSKKHYPCQPMTQLVIEGQSLERVTTFKYLGVLFSHDGSYG